MSKISVTEALDILQNFSKRKAIDGRGEAYSAKDYDSIKQWLNLNERATILGEAAFDQQAVDLAIRILLSLEDC